MEKRLNVDEQGNVDLATFHHPSVSICNQGGNAICNEGMVVVMPPKGVGKIVLKAISILRVAED